MKTVKIVFTEELHANLNAYKGYRLYTFVTKDDLKVGDVLKSQDYGSQLLVMDIQPGEPQNLPFKVKELKVYDVIPPDIVLAVHLGNIDNMQE